MQPKPPSYQAASEPAKTSGIGNCCLATAPATRCAGKLFAGQRAIFCMRRLVVLAMASFATEENSWTAPRELRATHSLRIVTWNIWFDHRQAAPRLKLLLSLLSQQKADVIGLQEVTTQAAEKVRQHHGITSRYDISENAISGYGCLLLVRRELNPAFAELPLPTTMGRSLVAACVYKSKFHGAF